MARLKGFISAEAIFALVIVAFGVTLYYDSISQLFNKREAPMESLNNYLEAKRMLHQNPLNNENIEIEFLPNEQDFIIKEIQKGKYKIQSIERKK